MRDGHKMDLPAEELVVGDIVFVKIGDKTPAGNSWKQTAIDRHFFSLL